MQQVTLAIHGAPADLLEIDSAFTQRGLVTNQFLNGVGLHVAFNTNEIYMDIVNQLNMTFQEYQGVHSIAIQGSLYLVDDASLIVGGLIVPVKFINLRYQEEYIDRLSNYVSRHRGDRRRSRFDREERNMIERQSSRASRNAPFWDRGVSRHRDEDRRSRHRDVDDRYRDRRDETRSKPITINDITIDNTFINSPDKSRLTVADNAIFDIEPTENGFQFIDLWGWFTSNVEGFNRQSLREQEDQLKLFLVTVLTAAGMLSHANGEVGIILRAGDVFLTLEQAHPEPEPEPAKPKHASVEQLDVSLALEVGEESKSNSLIVDGHEVKILSESDGLTFIELDSLLNELIQGYGELGANDRIKAVKQVLLRVGYDCVEEDHCRVTIALNGDVNCDLDQPATKDVHKPTPVAGEITTMVLSEKVLASSIKQVTKVFADRDQRKSVDAIRYNGVVYLRNGDVVSPVHITAIPDTKAITFHIGDQLRGLSAYRISTFVKALAGALNGFHPTDKLNHDGDLVIAFGNYEEISVADYVMETIAPEEPTISEPKSGLVSVEEMKPVTEEYVIDETPQVNVVYVARVEDTDVELIEERDGTTTLRYNIASVREKTNRVSLYGRVITELGNYLMEEGFTDEVRTRDHWVMTIKGEYAYLRGYDNLNPQESWIKVSDALEMQFLNTYISSI